MSNLALNDDARAAVDLTPTDRTMLDNIRGNKLVELARAHFDPHTTDAEIEVLRASASVVDPPWPNKKTERPEIRPEFLRWLATDPEAAPCVAPKGIRAFYVTVPGGLDFYGYRIPFPVMFWLSRIDGPVNLQSAETFDLFFLNSEVTGSIVGDRVNVKGSLILRSSRFCGGLFLGGAQIKGDLDCASADFFLKGAATERIKRGDAISVDYADIGGSLVCKSGFVSNGGICLASTKIGQDLLFFGSRTGNIDCRGMQLAGDFQWLRMEAAKDDKKKEERSGKGSAEGGKTDLDVKLDLSNASIRNLLDDRVSWPAREKLVLDGFVYKGLLLHADPAPGEEDTGALPPDAETTPGERIDWLMRQDENERTKPQPWIQLATYLDSKGDHRGAKHVLYRLKWLRGPNPDGRRETDKQWNPGFRSDLGDIHAALWGFPAYLKTPIRSFKKAFAWLEEVPFRILWSMSLLLLTGSAIFSYAASQRALAPTDETVYTDFTKNGNLPGTYPKLNPIVYAFETSIPVAKFGQEEKWAPDPHGSYNDPNHPWKSFFTSYRFLTWTRWLLIFSGWFQAIVLAAALSGLFKE